MHRHVGPSLCADSKRPSAPLSERMAYSASNGSSGWSPLPMDTRDSPVLTPSRRAPPVPGSASRAPAPSPGSPASYARGAVPIIPARSPQLSSSYGSNGSPGPATIIRRGWVAVKEDGLRAWLWSKRWLILREHTLTVHKNEVGYLQL